ncbi:MAG TPA: class I SAM-dependent methyltransferase [Longimicrobiales bacterium]
MVIAEIRADIDAIERDPSLYDAVSFGRRAAALDSIEFDVIDRIQGLLGTTTTPPDTLIELERCAERVRRRLAAIDRRMFRRLRAEIRAGRCAGRALRTVIDESVECDVVGGRRRDEPGYDHLDAFVNGLLLTRPIPVETKAREPEMVRYQQTPARVIFELVDRARLAGDDVFYDLGSGLGHVPILVNLLSGATARGVEFEPAYCDYARARAADLKLSRVAFTNADARAADYSDGTVFFLYTPFVGAMLDEVLERLRRLSRRRRIRLFTYGPCTPWVARQGWLESPDGERHHAFRLAAFTSRPANATRAAMTGG